MKGKRFVASWSGGKDSALAFYRAIEAGGIPARLFTMFEEDGERSKSHALSADVVKAQAERLNVPLTIRGSTWETYESEFIHTMTECVEEGTRFGVFGDIDLQGHLDWVQKTCVKVGMEPIHPLWMEQRRKLLDEFVDLGFEAYIIVVHNERMPAEFAGRKFTKELMDELEALGIDPCGEEGEFHTVVVDGPIFTSRVPAYFGEKNKRNGYTFVEVLI